MEEWKARIQLLNKEYQNCFIDSNNCKFTHKLNYRFLNKPSYSEIHKFKIDYCALWDLGEFTRIISDYIDMVFFLPKKYWYTSGLNHPSKFAELNFNHPDMDDLFA